MKDNNPLLDFSGLPRFAEIRPEHVTPAVDSLLGSDDGLGVFESMLARVTA